MYHYVRYWILFAGWVIIFTGSGYRCSSVNEVNLPPAVFSIQDKWTYLGTVITPFYVQAVDPDYDILLYSATGLPKGITIDASTGECSGKVSDTASLGYHQVTVSVTETDESNTYRGQTASTSFIWKVVEPMAFKRIYAGSFEMGSDQGSELADTYPSHSITLTHDFELGIYEVTQEDFLAVFGDNPSEIRDDDRLPVESITWFQAVQFTNELSKLAGHTHCYDDDGFVIDGGGNPYECVGYRLPTEAEWEYATRAGSKSAYSLSNMPLGTYAWYSENSNERTHVVGLKLPNSWGLYDVHGNVVEWINDWYDEDYYRHSPPVDPTGPQTGNRRVIRGGSWIYDSFLLTSYFRHAFPPDYRTYYIGFRVARTVF